MAQVHVPEHAIKSLCVALRRDYRKHADNQKGNDVLFHNSLSFVIISFCRNGSVMRTQCHSPRNGKGCRQVFLHFFYMSPLPV